MPRLFFALQPLPTQSETLVEAVAPVIAALGGQPVPAANLHATLCFIGAIEEEQVPRLREAAGQVRSGPVSLEFDALEAWEKPEILCAVAGADITARDLSIAIGDAATGAGFSPDIKPFRAHLTLARKVRRSVATKHQWPVVLAHPVSMRCENFVLMESRRTDAGSIYSVLDSWPLYADASR